VDAAESVAERLEALALRGKDDAAWIGLTPALTVEPLWVDLYGGTPGVSLFLAYLGAITGKARYSELGRAAWMTVRRQLESRERPCTSVGAFNGLGGILYVLSQLSTLWEEPGLEAEAERVLEALPPLIDKDDELDLLGGCAGCILALGALRRAMPGLAARALELVVRCGERLLSSARRLPEGLGWSGASSPRPLSGLAHGAAGYALALDELAKATRDLRFREAALAALEYERGLFSREAGNWRDLRDPRLLGGAPGEIIYSMGWCHGAPGIGLSRLCLLDSADDESLRTEIAVALETTSAHGFGMSHALCHGDLGNIELLVKAGETLEEGEHWRQRSLLLAGAILRSIQESGWRCGNPSKLEEPGLMTGLAGIGYGLLRLADPLRVPCVLALEPPSEARTAARWVSSMSRTAAWAPLT
jgi:type 2 lantibiotic biosynthesis protein LanM